MCQELTLTEKAVSELERIARNCDFYAKNNDQNHYINEVGCLRGAMYIADLIGCKYPIQQYYDLYIKNVYENFFKD